MKLCIFQPFGQRRGGSDNILLTALRHMDRSRVEPLVAFFGEGDFVDDVAALDISTVSFPHGRLRNPRHVVATARRVRRLLEEESPDLVLNWLSTAHVYAGLGAWMASMSDRCVWWQLDMIADRAPERARLVDRGATLRGRTLDRIATAIPSKAIGCCSESVRLAQERIPPKRPTFSVLPGIDPPERLNLADRENLREELGFKEDDVVIGIVGRLFAWKGHHHLIRAISLLNRRDERIRGLFVGGGGHRPDPGYERFLHDLVRDAGLEMRVHFTGQVTDATRYVQAMDVFVNASSPEPFGLVVLEAMALGVPCVAVDAGGPSEIIDHGTSGLLVPSNDPHVLAEAVDALVSNATLRAKLARRASSEYEDRFTGRRMAAEMQLKLEELAT